MAERPKGNEKWLKKLTPEQYRVMRECGTEPAFDNKYWNFHGKGKYTCAACGAELFSSEKKFDSGTGWPSFWEAVDEGRLELLKDRTLGMERIEVRCRACGGHLGHLFDDGPQPTGKRYCINSTALAFKENKRK